MIHSVENLLDEISLKAFVSLRQTFTGFVMVPELRKWTIGVDIRLNPGQKFTIENDNLLALLNEAKQRIDEYYTLHPLEPWP